VLHDEFVSGNGNAKDIARPSTLSGDAIWPMRGNRNFYKEVIEGAVIYSTKPAAGTPTTGLWHKTK
jgi:hypothetical protein